MSLLRITDLNIERFELNAQPKRTFSSSSVHGVTGSVPLFADNSTAIADVLTTNSSAKVFNDAVLENCPTSRCRRCRYRWIRKVHGGR